MELKADFAKIVGMPKEGRDSWVYVEDGLFLVLELAGFPDFPVAQKGKEIIDALSQAYKNLPQKNLANLQELIREVKTEEGMSLSLVLGAQIGKVLYFVCRGGGEVIVRRQGKFGQILEGEGSASGLLEEKDVFILASTRFAEIVSFEEVKSVFDNFSLTELAEGLTSLVHRTSDTSGVACLILQFKKIEKEKWEEEIPASSGEAGFGEAKEDTRYSLIRKKLSSIIYYLSSLFRRSSALYLRIPQNEEERKKRIVFWVAIILAVLLGASIVLGIGKKERGKKESGFGQTYELASHQYEEGKTLLGLNNLRALTLLGEAKDALFKINKDFKKESSEAKKIDELLLKIEQGREAASQVFKVSPDVFFDLTLIKEGGEGQKLAIYSQNLVVLDNKNSSLASKKQTNEASLYQITVKSKSSQILGGGEDLRGLSQVTALEDRVYILAEKGILEVGVKSQKSKVKIERDKDWGEIVDLAIFAGNLYLLDKTASQIWKYIGGETGFSGKRNYLTGEYSLANASSMAIDGSVWVTTGQVLKFTQGKQDSFEIVGLGQPFGTELLLFTSDETKNLYILDKTSNRVVVLEKTGTYKSQYIIENLSGITDMAVSEENKKIFLLSGSKIYQIELK